MITFKINIMKHAICNNDKPDISSLENESYASLQVMMCDGNNARSMYSVSDMFLFFSVSL